MLFAYFLIKDVVIREGADDDDKPKPKKPTS
jgi:hypothetical protein